MTLRLSVIALGLMPALVAQTPAVHPPAQFEVVSVRPSPALDPQNPRVDVGLHLNKDQARINALTLKDYIAWAYRVKTYQVSGPDWLTSERFDINGTMPAGTSEENIAEMLNALLAERFGLKIHKTQKEFPVYVLERGKKPLSLTKVEIGPQEEGGLTVGGSGSRDGISVSLGRGASYTFADNKLVGKKLNMETAAGILEGFLDLPVMDETKLDGYYDVELGVSAEDYRTMLIRAGMKNGIVMPPQVAKLLEGATNASLFDAIDRVGLKMENRKVPLDVINVDEIKRQPTEN